MMKELTRGYVQTRVFMDTPVVIELSAPGHDDGDLAERTERAFGWFAEVERRCSRFDETSELRALCRRVGEAMSVSTLLFSALNLSVRIADLTGGALDPTVGHAMEQSGFNTNYLTGKQVPSRLPKGSSGTYRDIVLDDDSHSVTLLRPMSLDLGAVAKGLAIDLAAEEFSGLPGFAINAGGDVLARGLNPDGEPWRIGIRHPRRHGELLTSLRITNAAVCTSGDYERPQAGGDGHHILNPINGEAARSAVSVTVVAPTALAADALSTAAFVLGPEASIDLLNSQGVDGLIVGPDLTVVATAGMERYRS
ncbi:MAG: FAD:protein FMN transferase [Chloroflexota bacterium]|nr:FAD:protein FMN transferase [Chloroflexota bacterium]